MNKVAENICYSEMMTHIRQGRYARRAGWHDILDGCFVFFRHGTTIAPEHVNKLSSVPPAVRSLILARQDMGAQFVADTAMISKQNVIAAFDENLPDMFAKDWEVFE